MPRAPRPRVSPPRQKRSIPVAPRHFSAEEKRQLILAHAAMRSARRDPTQLALVWTGVVATACVVAIGWIWAVGPSLLHAWSAPKGQTIGSLINEARSPATDSADAQAVAEALKSATQRLEVLSQEAARQQALQNIHTSGTASTSSSVPLFFSASSTVNP